jgi:hypothetical protein
MSRSALPHRERGCHESGTVRERPDRNSPGDGPVGLLVP